MRRIPRRSHSLMVQGRRGEEPCQVWELSGGVKLLRDTYSSSALISIILLLLETDSLQLLRIMSDGKRVQGEGRGKGRA